MVLELNIRKSSNVRSNLEPVLTSQYVFRCLFIFIVCNRQQCFGLRKWIRLTSGLWFVPARPSVFIPFLSLRLVPLRDALKALNCIPSIKQFSGEKWLMCTLSLKSIVICFNVEIGIRLTDYYGTLCIGQCGHLYSYQCVNVFRFYQLTLMSVISNN